MQTKKVSEPEMELKDIAEKTSLDNILAQVDTVGLAGLGDGKAMLDKMKKYEEIRSIIFKWIEDNFVKDVDWGPTDERSDKPTLKKPGAEKICRLFDTHPTWAMDRETWEMLGQPKDVACYICHIVDNSTGKIIGEGRGAEKVGNKGRDINKTIKNAEKCAIVDAALYTFMLSEKFTQDDGKAGKTQLAELKRIFINDIGEARAGVVSTLSDLNFLVAVIEAERHKKSIDSFGELSHMRKVVLEQKQYDFGTGKKK
jgi:hypothetical protein